MIALATFEVLLSHTKLASFTGAIKIINANNLVWLTAGWSTPVAVGLVVVEHRGSQIRKTIAREAGNNFLSIKEESRHGKQQQESDDQDQGKTDWLHHRYERHGAPFASCFRFALAPIVCRPTRLPRRAVIRSRERSAILLNNDLPTSTMMRSCLPLFFFFLLVSAAADARRLTVGQCITDSTTLFNDNTPLSIAASVWAGAFDLRAEECLNPSDPIVNGQKCTVDAGDTVTNTFRDRCGDASMGDFAPGVFEEIPTFKIICIDDNKKYTVTVKNWA